MALESKVFRSLGVFAVGVDSLSNMTLAALTNPDGKDDVGTAVKFKVDLTKTPLKGAWADVQCDDPGVRADGSPAQFSYTPWLVPLAITSVGSPTKAPIQTALLGGVYLEASLYKAVQIQNWPPKGYVMPQFTSVAYKSGVAGDTRSGKRYHGFFGKVIAVDKANTMVVVTLGNPPGTTTDIAVNWSDSDQCDSAPPSAALDGMPAGAVTNPSEMAVGNSVVIYLGLAFAVKKGARGPKMPIGLQDGDGPAVPPESHH